MFYIKAENHILLQYSLGALRQGTKKIESGLVFKGLLKRKTFKLLHPSHCPLKGKMISKKNVSRLRGLSLGTTMCLTVLNEQPHCNRPDTKVRETTKLTAMSSQIAANYGDVN